MRLSTYLFWAGITPFLLAIVLGLTPSFSGDKPVRKEPNYNIGTPAFDRSLLTNDEIVEIGGKQKVAVVGTDVFYLWLGNAQNKEIVSITSFNRGVQGSTSSFVIVYKIKEK